VFLEDSVVSMPSWKLDTCLLSALWHSVVLPLEIPAT